MANLWYPNGRSALAKGTVNWLSTGSNVPRVALVRGYTYNSAHSTVADVTSAGGTIVARMTLASATVTAGVIDAADVTFSAVPTGAACTSMIVFYSVGGVDASSPVLLYLDSIPGFPVTPNGGNINVQFDPAGIAAV